MTMRYRRRNRQGTSKSKFKSKSKNNYKYKPKSKKIRDENKNNRSQAQTGGKWSLKYKKSIDCNHPRGFSQRQHCKYGKRKFNQSGGDILNYLPSDMSMSLRALGNSFSSLASSVKGFAPAPSPLPYNDHKLQKTDVSVSERIPDIKTYYKNAMNLVPAL